nr:hypothetical protein [Tanacetum cinerariifolium]
MKLIVHVNGHNLGYRYLVQTSGSGNTFLLAVAFFLRQWEVPSGSGNFLTNSGNALCILFPTSHFWQSYVKLRAWRIQVLKRLPEDQTEVIDPKPLTLEFEPILEMEDEGLKCLQANQSTTYRSWEESRLEQEGGGTALLSVFFLQALKQRELSNTSFSKLDLAISANSVGVECYSSFDQSFSPSSNTTCCSRKVGSTTLNNKVIVTLSIDDEDAHEHVHRVLEITDLFYFPDVTHDAVMLRVFPVTLKGSVLRWINILLAGLVTTWDLLEKAFIRQYCPPFKTTKKLEIIFNSNKRWTRHCIMLGKGENEVVLWTLCKKSTLVIITWRKERHSGEDQVSILAKDKGFGQEMHQSEEPKALYGVTSPKDYAVTYSNKEMSYHTLHGVKYLQGMESLGAEFLGSASAVELAEAPCPGADSKCN